MHTIWYVLPLLLAASVSAVLARFAWRRRAAPGALAFALLMVAVAAWTLGYALELSSVALPTKILWAKVEYVGIVVVPVLWFVFAVHYTQQPARLAGPTLALLLLVPLLTLVLVWTNEAHGLIWRATTLMQYGTLVVLDVRYGLGFWLNAAYAYLLLLLGTRRLLLLLVHAPGLYRRQMVAVLLGALAPWVGNALYLFRLSPWPALDLTPFAFTFSGLVFAWGLWRVQLLAIVPVARDAVLESIRDGVIVLDVQHRVVDLNPAAQALLGRRAATLLGQPAAAVFAPQPALLAGYRQVLAAPQGAATHAEVVLDAGAGPCWFDLHSSPLYNRHRWLGHVLIMSDMTARKHAEDARAQVLTEQAARAEAEAEIRVRDEFLSVAAHELKTPLTALLGYTQLLHRRLRPTQPVSERDQRAVQVIVDQAERLNMLISLLLDLARLRRGTFSITPQPLDLGQLVQRVVEATELTLDHHQVQLTCPPGPLIVAGDELRLEQVLHNLLQNAIKYSPAGGLIGVQVERRGEEAWLVVSDEGVGISHAMQGQLFQPFVRGDNIDTRNISGFGIGLYLVHEIVTAHGGTVTVASTEGAGSTFTIRLPRRQYPG